MADYDNSNQIKGGLWTKVSQKGVKYLSGSITIDGKKYWTKLFTNTSENEKAPKCNLILQPADADVNYHNKPTNLDGPPDSAFNYDNTQSPDKEMPF